jgi:hypothetical protein
MGAENVCWILGFDSSYLHNRLYLIGMEQKQVNVKTMSDLTDKELEELLNALRMIDGFNFFVDSQFTIQNVVKEEKS